MAPDCKSGRESVRWFESIPAHHNEKNKCRRKAALLLLGLSDNDGYKSFFCKVLDKRRWGGGKIYGKILL